MGVMPSFKVQNPMFPGTARVNNVLQAIYRSGHSESIDTARANTNDGAIYDNSDDDMSGLVGKSLFPYPNKGIVPSYAFLQYCTRG